MAHLDLADAGTPAGTSSALAFYAVGRYNSPPD